MAGPVRAIGKINRDTVTQQIFTELRERIRAGEFLPGERLPGETQLSEDFGVSRSSVRAALQKLSILGLIETRVGEGTFIRERSFEHLMAEISALVADDSLIPYVAEFRQIVEASSARLALERATDAELSEFVDRAQGLVEKAASHDVSEYVKSDYEYHLSLSRLSHNPLFEMVYSSIRDLFTLSIRARLENTARAHPDALTASAAFHLRLALALQERNEAEVSELIDIIILRQGEEEEAQASPTGP
jgi:GntR family transcriptional repressor for pyruvate dehydrogenase complex